MLLLACPRCSRQYDATGLEPGTPVRCFCDEQFTVQWPPRLGAGALCCTNCGGAVGVEDASCPFCRAAISEEDRRRTTLCPGCFTRIQDDSRHCRACALPIAPQRLAPLPAGRDCPRCGGGLRVRALGPADVTECGACLGMWLTPDLFQRVTAEAARRNTAGDLFGLGKGGPLSELRLEAVSYIPCLVCGELMQRRQYRYAERPTGTIIDLCRDHGVWLDHEELERIVSHVERAAQGGAPTPAPAVHGSSLAFDRAPSGGASRLGWTLGDVLAWLFGDLFA